MNMKTNGFYTNPFFFSSCYSQEDDFPDRSYYLHMIFYAHERIQKKMFNF